MSSTEEKSFWKFGGMADRFENQAKRKGLVLNNSMQLQRMGDSASYLYMLGIVTEVEYAKIQKRMIRALNRNVKQIKGE